MDMAHVLGSRGNVPELLGMFEAIQSTHFGTLPNSWLEGTVCSVIYHAVPTDTGGEFVYYDQCSRRKIDAQTPKSRSAAAQIVLDDFPIGWVHF